MKYVIIGYILQYILAGVGLWQLITGKMLVGIILLLLTIALDNIFHPTAKAIK